jgi:hypothetical protein
MATVTARIYSPARTPTQSGRARTGQWLVVFEPQAARTIEPLMGYTSSTDTQAQVKLEFATEADAVAWCRRNGIDYTVQRPNAPRRRAMTYAENFAFNRKAPWTH